MAIQSANKIYAAAKRSHDMLYEEFGSPRDMLRAPRSTREHEVRRFSFGGTEVADLNGGAGGGTPGAGAGDEEEEEEEDEEEEEEENNVNDVVNDAAGAHTPRHARNRRAPVRLVDDEQEEEIEDNAPGAHAAALALGEGEEEEEEEEITPEEEEALFAGPVRKKQRR